MMVTTSHVASVHLGLEASVAAGDSWPGALSLLASLLSHISRGQFCSPRQSRRRLRRRRLLEEMTSLEVVWCSVVGVLGQQF